MFGLADKDLLRKYEKLDLMIFNIGESVRELEAKHQTLRNELDRLNHRIDMLEIHLYKQMQVTKPKTRN